MRPVSAAKSPAKATSDRRSAPAAMVIFGANGDLTKRLIFPALRHLVQAGELPDRFVIIGIDHNDRTTEQWRDLLAEAMQEGKKDHRVETNVWSWISQPDWSGSHCSGRLVFA